MKRVVGIDIGKGVLHLVGFDAAGGIVFRRKIKRLALADTFKKLQPCVVEMETSRREALLKQETMAATRIDAFS